MSAIGPTCFWPKSRRVGWNAQEGLTTPHGESQSSSGTACGGDDSRDLPARGLRVCSGSCWGGPDSVRVSTFVCSLGPQVSARLSASIGHRSRRAGGGFAQPPALDLSHRCRGTHRASALLPPFQKHCAVAMSPDSRPHEKLLHERDRLVSLASVE
jgi:hypothetical protein